MYGWNMRELDEFRRIDLMAWQNNQATAEKKKGKKIVPAFKEFDDFSQHKSRMEAFKRGYGKSKTQKVLQNKKELLKLLKQANS